MTSRKSEIRKPNPARRAEAQGRLVAARCSAEGWAFLLRPGRREEAMSSLPKVTAERIVRELWELRAGGSDYEDAAERFTQENPHLSKTIEDQLFELSDDPEKCDDPKVRMTDAWKLVVIAHELMRQEAEAQAESEAVPA